MNYRDFLESKTQSNDRLGFEPVFMPSFLFDFQKHICDWSVRKGRSAVFADCGMGKTAMELVWAENVVRKTNKPVLLLTPLAVGAQTIIESEKFGIDSVRSNGGTHKDAKVVVTNYQKLGNFDPNDFGGCVCDESSILKNFDGAIKSEITEFMRKMRYRLLCTATAAPNDFIELGTSSEALGYLGYMDMLSMFFKNDQNSSHPNRRWSGGAKWRFRGHARERFWQWVCSWAIACRKPSDLGYSDDGFELPPMAINQHIVENREMLDGFLFAMPAVTLQEQRQERAKTLVERCDKVAELVQNKGDFAVCWTHLNGEADLLEKLIPGAIQVSGADSDDEKERKFCDFANGDAKVLITKPIIAGFGLNWQHCNYQTFFPSHSFEQWYQSVRRCWRFGQKRPVTVDIISTEGESRVIENLQRKQESAKEMFAELIANMNEASNVESKKNHSNKTELPSWL